MLDLSFPDGQKLVDFLHARFPLPPEEQEADVPTLWRTSSNTDKITRLFLALDARAFTPFAACQEPSEGDVVFLHRPFGLAADVWPDIPVFASHRGLDAHLSVGANPALQKTLNLYNVSHLWREAESPDTNHPIGMVGDLNQPVRFHQLLNGLSLVFGGMEAALVNGQNAVSRLAVVGAMTPELVRQAAQDGAQGYLTGQIRDVARAEAERLNVAVFATGHKRAELWGLKQLARELEASFPALKAIVVD